ncbi:MAG: hypothetical protein ACTS3F_01905 [Phycisphaerales bacterium]
MPIPPQAAHHSTSPPSAGTDTIARSATPAIASAIPAAASTLEGKHGLIGIKILRELPSHHNARRFLARRTEDNTPVLLYRVGPWTTLADPSTFVDRTFELRHLRAENICPIKDAAVATDNGCWLIAAYPGHAGGLITLQDAVNAREGGRLGRHEARTVIAQVLAACAAAHRIGIVHGPISIDDLLLTPRGRVVVELYGLENCLRAPLAISPAQRAEDIAAEVRSVARLAYFLLTGSACPADRAQHSPAEAAQLRKRLRRLVPCPRWRAWLAEFLLAPEHPDRITAESALSALHRDHRAESRTPASAPSSTARRAGVGNAGSNAPNAVTLGGRVARSARRFGGRWATRALTTRRGRAHR